MAKKFISVTIAVVFFFSLFFAGTKISHASSQGIQPGSANQVEMLQQPLNDMDSAIEKAISEKVMPGAVVLVARHGTIVKQEAYGYAARYKDSDFTEMEHPVKTQKNTIYDLASMSKLFTATAVMQLWDQGKFDLDDPVADYIPEFAENGKEDVTIRQLLTHTSGFRPDPPTPLYKIGGDRQDRLDYVLKEPLENPPGTHYVYSDINFMTLGVLVEHLSGQREDAYVHDHITVPLQMTDTMYNPPESLKERIAATEDQPWTNRGLVWGSVHDENAWALDGVAGHAGVFSTAHDLAIFAQMMLTKGKYEGKRVLSKQAVQLMDTNWNGDFPGQDHGLGWELNQDWYMDGLAESNTMGHTGYTGTSIVVSPNKDAMVILLTNRVHPTRDTVSTNSIRKKMTEKTADAIYAWNADYMSKLVDYLDNKGGFTSDDAVHSLKVHLTAVSHYEEKQMRDKVIKHMEGFKTLLEHQKNEDLISNDAYNKLTEDANYLIGKWQ